MLNQINLKNGYIIIEEYTEQKNSNIILPDEKYNRLAKVLKVSDDCTQVKPNDIVYKTLGNGTEFTLNNTKYEAIHENYILMIL